MDLPKNIIESPLRVQISEALIERDSKYAALESVQQAYRYYKTLEEKTTEEIKTLKEKGKLTFNILDKKTNKLVENYNELLSQNSTLPDIETLDSIYEAMNSYYRHNKKINSCLTKDLVDIGLIRNEKDISNLKDNLEKLLEKYKSITKNNRFADFTGFFVDDSLTIKDLKRRIQFLQEKHQLEHDYAHSMKSSYKKNISNTKKILCNASLISNQDII